MNRTLSEIDAIIEAEVERRCAHRMRSYSLQLREISERMSYEEFGAPREQMTDGIEIKPSKEAEVQSTIPVEPALLGGVSERALDDAMLHSNESVVTAVRGEPGRMIVTKSPLSEEEIAALDVLVESRTSVLLDTARNIPMLQPADADGGDAIPEGSPEWLAPALAKLRPAKERDILRRIALEGGVTLQEVIYHFRPPIKESYASVILSGVGRALRAAGMCLQRDIEGVYRVKADA